MRKIEEERFRAVQPPYGKQDPTEGYYLRTADILFRKCQESGLRKVWPENVLEGLAIGLTCYFQDVVADAGLWRAFISEERRLHGRTLPYFNVAEDYIDFELNPEDVRFLVWYYLSQTHTPTRLMPPDEETIARLAERLYGVLEDRYDDAVESPAWLFAREFDLHEPADQEQILKIGNWLFLNSYLMSPISVTTMRLAVEAQGGSGSLSQVQAARIVGEAMTENPTGPLALYMREWMYLLFENRLPEERLAENNRGENPTYLKFLEATGGEPVAFLKDHAELNAFLVEKLGWSEEEHFGQLKNERDMVLMVNKEKGMLIARNVAQCIDYPGNTLYDKERSKKKSLELLTVRGRCPGDLLRFLFEKKALPDVAFPGEKSPLALDNLDFTARCFLQLYYRGD